MKTPLEQVEAERDAAQDAVADMLNKFGLIAHSLGQAFKSSPDEQRTKVALTLGMVNELCHRYSTAGVGYLSPKDAKLREEVKAAWAEARKQTKEEKEDHEGDTFTEYSLAVAWENSRARRVAEGVEL